MVVQFNNLRGSTQTTDDSLLVILDPQYPIVRVFHTNKMRICTDCKKNFDIPLPPNAVRNLWTASEIIFLLHFMKINTRIIEVHSLLS